MKPGRGAAGPGGRAAGQTPSGRLGIQVHRTVKERKFSPGRARSLSARGSAKRRRQKAVSVRLCVKTPAKMKLVKDEAKNDWDDLSGEVERVVDTIFDEVESARLQCESEIGADLLTQKGVVLEQPPGVLGILIDDELTVIDVVPFSPADDSKEISFGDQLISVDNVPVLGVVSKEQVHPTYPPIHQFPP